MQRLRAACWYRPPKLLSVKDLPNRPITAQLQRTTPPEAVSQKSRNRQQTGKEVTRAVNAKILKNRLLDTYKNNTTKDKEVIYKFRNGSQIGSSLVSLMNQILSAQKSKVKLHDLDLFCFYSIHVKKIPIKLFRNVVPNIGEIIIKMRKSIQHEF